QEFLELRRIEPSPECAIEFFGDLGCGGGTVQPAQQERLLRSDLVIVKPDGILHHVLAAVTEWTHDQLRAGAREFWLAGCCHVATAGFRWISTSSLCMARCACDS